MASVTLAVLDAAKNAGNRIVLMVTPAKESPFHGKRPDDLKFVDGHVQQRGSAATTVAVADILKMNRVNAASGSGKSPGMFDDPNAKFSSHSFGAHCVEVT